MKNPTSKYSILATLTLLACFFFLFHVNNNDSINPKLEREKRVSKAYSEPNGFGRSNHKTPKSKNIIKLNSQKLETGISAKENRHINEDDISETLNYVNLGNEVVDEHNSIDEVLEQFRRADVSEEEMDALITSVFPEDQEIEKAIKLPGDKEKELIQNETLTPDEFKEAFFNELLKSNMPEGQAHELADSMFSESMTENEINLESLVSKYSGEVILLVEILRSSGVPPEEIEPAIEAILDR